jgi:hypothetical protein
MKYRIFCLALALIMGVVSVSEAGFFRNLAKRARHPFGGCSSGSCR